MNENPQISAESQNTIFIFYPTLTLKLLNQFHHLFTRYRATSGAINAHICKG